MKYADIEAKAYEEFENQKRERQQQRQQERDKQSFQRRDDGGARHKGNNHDKDNNKRRYNNNEESEDLNTVQEKTGINFGSGGPQKFTRTKPKTEEQEHKILDQPDLDKRLSAAPTDGSHRTVTDKTKEEGVKPEKNPQGEKQPREHNQQQKEQRPPRQNREQQEPNQDRPETEQR